MKRIFRVSCCLVAFAFKPASSHAASHSACRSTEELRASALAYHPTDSDLTLLKDPSLCVDLKSVANGALEWPMVLVRHRRDPDRLLWYAPHTNEAVAFRNAVAAVIHHHGTLVAIRTPDGERCLKDQDPNRVFGTLQGGGDSCSGKGVKCTPSASGTVPPFTAEVMNWHAAGAPIVGLHTNEKGYDSSAGCSRPTGRGNVTAACSRRSLTVLRPDKPARGSSPDDTMVYVAAANSSETAIGLDPGLASVVKDLRGLRTNVIFERVGRTDCSLSNYAVLHGIPHYFNVEVESSDATGQATIINDLLDSMERHRLVDISLSSAN